MKEEFREMSRKREVRMTVTACTSFQGIFLIVSHELAGKGSAGNRAARIM